VAATGAVLVNVLIGTGPAAQAEAGPSESIRVAQQLGLTAATGPADGRENLDPLEQLAASRDTRETEQAAAQQTQVAADRAALDRRKAEAADRAEAEAAARTAAEAAEAAAASTAASAATEAAAEASAQPPAEEAAAPAPAVEASPATTAVPGNRSARISNSAGAVRPQVQTAADAVVSNVPGAGGLTLGGTRASATDPHGHPSGLALDYMVLSDAALGDAIVQYHIAHWDELGVDYLIWQQRMLASPSGSWEHMADRGGTTANHMDHVHVNYRG
jgi:hypothetical protein